MTLLRSVWLRQIARDLFKDNAFLDKSLNWNDEVKEGTKTVTIQQSGGRNTVKRNRTVFPAEANERTDSDITYDMVDYTTDPRRVRKLVEKQYSPEYRADVLRQDMETLREYVAEDILYAWRPELTKNIIKTTGGAVAASATPAATGNRKAMTFADIVKAQKLLTDALVPQGGRCALLTSQHQADLLLDPQLSQLVYAQLVNYKEGQILNLAGFDLMIRSKVLTFDATGQTAKLPDATAATTDCECSLFWHPSFVGRSVGNMDIFYNPNRAEHYGDILSFELQAGGSKFYSDGRGVIGVVQAQAA